MSTPDVVIKSRARLSLRARDAGASPAFWHRSKSVLRAAGSASEIVSTALGGRRPQPPQAGLGDTADVDTGFRVRSRLHRRPGERVDDRQLPAERPLTARPNCSPRDWRRSAIHPSRPFATVAVEDGFGVRRREGLRLLGAVPHPSPECPRPAPPHPRERQSRIGPRAAPAPWTQRPVARRAIADITPRRQPIGHGGAA